MLSDVVLVHGQDLLHRQREPREQRLLLDREVRTRSRLRHIEDAEHARKPREIRRKAPKSPVEALQTAALPGPASDTARDSGRGSERFAFRRGLRAGQM